jgi:hypothetical protein
MLRHIISMKLAAEDETVRLGHSSRLAAALAGLPPKIPQIRDLNVGTNVVPGPGNWDLVMTVDLDDAEALEAYRVHPAHQEVLKLIGEVVAQRCAVDFLL